MSSEIYSKHEPELPKFQRFQSVCAGIKSPFERVHVFDHELWCDIELAR